MQNQPSFLHQKYSLHHSKGAHVVASPSPSPSASSSRAPSLSRTNSASDAHPPPHRKQPRDEHQERDEQRQQQKPPRRSPKHTLPPPLPPSTAPRAPSSSHLKGSSLQSQRGQAKNDDDDTDDDADSPGAGGDVEDVCLGCAGVCVCGAAKALPLYVPKSAPRAPIKVRITMSSVPAVPAPAPAPAPASEWSTHTTHRAFRSFSEEHEAYEDRPRPKKASHASTNVPGSSHKKKVGGAATGRAPRPPKAPVDPLAPPRKRGRPRKDGSTSAPARPPKASASASAAQQPAGVLSGATPQRMSLRQVLAASVRDAGPASERSHSPPPVFVAPAPAQQRDKERLDVLDVSDLELDDLDSSESGSENENAIERAEERALRLDYERAQAGDDDTSDEDEADLSDFDEEDEGRAAQARKAHKGDSTREGSSFEQGSDLETFSGGRGVVTWEDYDQETADEDESMERVLPGPDGAAVEMEEDLAGEFEDELEELFKLSEQIVGPVQEGELFFLEEVSSNQGDDEEGGSSSDDSDALPDESVLIVDGWYHERRRRTTGESSDDSAQYDDDDQEGDDMDWSSDSEHGSGGETTDSLDSDDHVGMVRFGIEVDSDSTDDETDGPKGDLANLPPGTASLADVQAPTLADLASLPQYLFAHAATGVVDGLDVVLLDEAIDRKGKGRARVPDIDEEDEDELARGPPAMGVFGAPSDSHGKKRSADRSVVIDESGTLAASPFSKLKRKRRGRQLLDGTPSRRTRADSKVSTTSGPSVTDGSLSGELADLASPFTNAAALDFDLDSVLHASLLERSSSSSCSSSSETRVPSGPTGLSDLSRWSRIPIGAFRSSSSATNPHLASSADPRHRSLAASSLSHTLSSPHNISTTRRAIERRMLTSPVFGPSISSAVPTAPSSNPKSHKARRKEKKKSSSSIQERVSGPQSDLLRPPPSLADQFLAQVATPSSLLLAPDPSQVFRPF